MKISVPKVKPRNPVAPGAAKRKAGSHTPSKGSLRRRAAQELTKEVVDLSLEGKNRRGR